MILKYVVLLGKTSVSLDENEDFVLASFWHFFRWMNHFFRWTSQVKFGSLDEFLRNLLSILTC